MTQKVAPLALQLILCSRAAVEPESNLFHIFNVFDVFCADTAQPKPYLVKPFCVVAQVGARQEGTHQLRLYFVRAQTGECWLEPVAQRVAFSEGGGTRTVIFGFADGIDFEAPGSYFIDLYDGDEWLADRVLHIVEGKEIET